MSPLELLPKQDFGDIRTVGIPQALLYYRYHVLWQTFFESLGCTVVISNPSDRALLERGEALSIDECCLASKLYLGHAESLLDSCDALFVPSIDNLGLHKGFCTKFQALPDLVTNTFASKKVRIISCEIDKEDTGISAEEAYVSIANRFGLTKKQGKAAYLDALHAQKSTMNSLHKHKQNYLRPQKNFPLNSAPYVY